MCCIHMSYLHLTHRPSCWFGACVCGGGGVRMWDVWCRLLCVKMGGTGHHVSVCVSLVRACSGCCRLVVVYACDELEKYACGRGCVCLYRVSLS